MNALEMFKHNTLNAQILNQTRQNLLSALEGRGENPSNLLEVLLKLILELLERIGSETPEAALEAVVA